MKILLLSVLVVSLLSITFVTSANAIFSPVIPIFEVDKVPNEKDFKSIKQEVLVKDFTPFSVTRDNGEKIESYYLYNPKSHELRLLVYMEDSTQSKLKNYVPFNSDFFTMYFAIDSEEPNFIYAERNGDSCIFPIEHYEKFWAGNYRSCVGGSVTVKDTDDGWAIYVKFTGNIRSPTLSEPYDVYFDYGDITKSDKDGILEEITYYSYPDRITIGNAIPISKEKTETVNVNSGRITVDDFLYKPYNLLVEGLEKNSFDCADNTLIVTSKKDWYTIDDVANIKARLNSDIPIENAYLEVFDSDLNLLHSAYTTFSSKNEASFSIDLDRMLEDKSQSGIFLAEVRAEVNGPKNSVYFAVENNPLPEKDADCEFYLTYDKFSKSASFVISVNDPTHTGYDQIQIFVDKNGDSIDKQTPNTFSVTPNKDDVSYVIDTNQFGATKYESDGSWITNTKHDAQGRMLMQKNGYLAFVNIDNVSENFRFALEQVDLTGYDIKSVRYPNGAFSTLPQKWADVNITGNTATKLQADKYQPDEIVVTQMLDVNLILVGDIWESEIKNMVKNQLNTKYSPFISSELKRSGITYHYNFDFVSISEDDSNDLFDFVKSESKRGGLYGSNDFNHPWGLGPWIQANHTEWISTFNSYDVDFKKMDAEKMQDYIYDNIISKNNKFNRSSSVNLVFLAGDMDDIDFLHTYNTVRMDSANVYTNHEAVGLMGYGGKYNFYFFDLYSVPWHELQGLGNLWYDKSWDNFAINLHDIHTKKRHAQLISDYVNNSTSLMITPSYLYEPTYKSEYTLDLTIVSDSSVASEELIQYYINEEKIKSQLEELTPFSKWIIKTTVIDSKSRDLPQSLKSAINSKVSWDLVEGYPEFGKVNILIVDDIKKAVTEWSTTKDSSQFKDFKDISESSWTIPVIVVSDSKYNYVALWDDGFASGIAPAHPDNPQQPCCAFGVTTDYEVWDKKNSATDLVIHEIGHTLGFMHPFMGYTNEGEFTTYEYFEKWYPSVMAYNSPSTYGCGFWYAFYVEDWCGIADTYFTEFEKENYYRGVAVYLIKSAKTNVYNSMINLERDKQDLNNLPEGTKQVFSEIDILLNKANSALKANNLESSNGAIKYALEAAKLSSQIAAESDVVYKTTTTEKIKLELPIWVKSNAEWWANDAISETEFLRAIEYLIVHKIIILPEIPESKTDSSSAKVPEWVKNNAGWWAKGTINDSDFINGIQYLVSQGLIKISAPQEKNTIEDSPVQISTEKVSQPAYLKTNTVTIIGSVPEYHSGFPVVFTIILPDGSEEETKIRISSDGIFKYDYTIKHDSAIGKYEFIIKYDYKNIDLGSVSFYVTEK